MAMAVVGRTELEGERGAGASSPGKVMMAPRLSQAASREAEQWLDVESTWRYSQQGCEPHSPPGAGSVSRKRNASPGPQSRKGRVRVWGVRGPVSEN